MLYFHGKVTLALLLPSIGNTIVVVLELNTHVIVAIWIVGGTSYPFVVPNIGWNSSNVVKALMWKS